MLGAFTPKCQSDGSFEQKQCHGSTGHCWCVNSQTGQELQGTRRGPGQGEVNCNRPCDLARANSKPGMVGSFTPKCQSDGTYEQKQCHGSTGQCWCVNSQTGQEVQGTRKNPGQGEPNCRPCDMAKASNLKQGMVGGFAPKCQSDGTYEQKQCQGSTGYCWCVDAQTGKELQGTRKAPGQGEPNCGKCFLDFYLMITC